MGMDNLYGDRRQTPASQTNVTSTEVLGPIIGFDLSSNLTLKNAIDTFKTQTDHLPDNTDILVYFVCGHEFNFKDLVYFLDYLDGVRFRNIKIMYRGVIVPETFILFFDKRVTFTEHSVLLYRPSEMYKFYGLLSLVNTNAFDTFMKIVQTHAHESQIPITKFTVLK
jgi:small nuclear ribonucleoprotein (snRNP)-like protein